MSSEKVTEVVIGLMVYRSSDCMVLRTRSSRIESVIQDPAAMAKVPQEKQRQLRTLAKEYQNAMAALGC